MSLGFWNGQEHLFYVEYTFLYIRILFRNIYLPVSTKNSQVSYTWTVLSLTERYLIPIPLSKITTQEGNLQVDCSEDAAVPQMQLELEQLKAEIRILKRDSITV